MKDISPRIASQKPGSVLAPGNAALAQAINEFLAWLELTKGMRLCAAFRPQYDWYMPVPTNGEGLALEFLEKTAFADFGKENPHEASE